MTLRISSIVFVVSDYFFLSVKMAEAQLYSRDLLYTPAQELVEKLPQLLSFHDWLETTGTGGSQELHWCEVLIARARVMKAANLGR